MHPQPQLYRLSKRPWLADHHDRVCYCHHENLISIPSILFIDSVSYMYYFPNYFLQFPTMSLIMKGPFTYSVHYERKAGSQKYSCIIMGKGRLSGRKGRWRRGEEDVI